jgi:eukaryotic-like serine/threonine-protein kinase
MKGIADYEFVDTLGEGNYGWFYLAKRPPRLPVPDELVAVKVLNSAATTRSYSRAVRELQAFAALSSPYLVRLYDAGQDDSVVYYAMEHHPMGSLARPATPLSPRAACAAVADAARAAHALHEVGLVHRDIKPGNVLLTADGGRLSDLGLAHHLSPGQTLTAMGPIRSIEYIDPRVLRGDRVSRASDVWSLGATLHFALAGRGPYPGLAEDDPLLALRSVMKQEPVIGGAVGEAAARVVEKCLAPDPSARYRTALALAEDIASLPEIGQRDG